MAPQGQQLFANAGVLGGAALAFQEYSRTSSTAPNTFMGTFQ